MANTLIVTEARLFAWLRLIFCAIVTALMAFSAAWQDDWLFRVLAALLAAFFALGTYLLLIRTRGRPQRLVTFTHHGIIDEFEQEYLWHQIDRIWMFTGCLFLKAQESRDWTVRLDPAEVGWKTVREARAFVKRYAPPMLTAKI